MYIPKHFAAGDDDVRDLLENHGAADLVTATADGLIATFLPFVFDPLVGEHGALLGHVARNNDQWRRSPTGPPEAAALVIVRVFRTSSVLTRITRCEPPLRSSPR